MTLQPPLAVRVPSWKARRMVVAWTSGLGEPLSVTLTDTNCRPSTVVSALPAGPVGALEGPLIAPVVAWDVGDLLGVAVGGWLGARVGEGVGAAPKVQAVSAGARTRSDAVVFVFMAR